MGPAGEWKWDGEEAGKWEILLELGHHVIANTMGLTAAKWRYGDVLVP